MTLKDAKMKTKTGSATIEYIIILPLVFACIVAVIVVFAALYQKSMVQSLAESTAEGLSMTWGHSPLSPDDIETGAYSRQSYDSRQLYWQILPLPKGVKEGIAKEWTMDQLKGIGLLRETEDKPSSVDINYAIGFPFSKIHVEITANYRLPGAALLKFIGLGDYLIIKGYAEATVYDQKELINNSDYVIQKVRESSLPEFLAKVLEPLKKGLDMLGGGN